MNILNKVTLQSLKNNRIRTAVTIIGVVLSVALLTAVTTFVVSLQDNLLRGEIATNGDWHVKFIDLNPGLAERISADEDVQGVAAIHNIGYALLDGSLRPSRPYLFVAGIDGPAAEMLSISLVSGRLPENDREIVISEHISADSSVGYKVGDRLTLSLGRRTLMGEEVGQATSFQNGEMDTSREIFTAETEKSYTIVGVCKRPGFESYSSPGYTAITKPDPSPDKAEDKLDLLVKMKSPGKVYGFAERVAEDAGYEFNGALLRYHGVSLNDNFNTVLYSLSGILIAIIMAASILLIYNSFAISVSERSRQFGVLSSVGATKKQLRKSVLFEGACIGLVGIPIGLIVGICGVGVTLILIDAPYRSIAQANTGLSLKLSAAALAIAVLIGIITILISAYIPAYRAVKKPAIDIIRQTDDLRIKARDVRSSRLVGRLFGLEGTLAMKNFKRNRKRYRSTVISLFVSIVLFISASAFGMYLRQGVELTVPDYGYDISLATSQSSLRLEDERLLQLYDQMKGAEGVTKSAYWNSLSCLVPIKSGQFTERFFEYYFADTGESGEVVDFSMSIYFIDDALYSRYLDSLGLSSKDYGVEQGRLPATATLRGYDSSLQRTVSFDLFKERALTLDIAADMVQGQDAADGATNGQGAADGQDASGGAADGAAGSQEQGHEDAPLQQRDAASHRVTLAISDTWPEGFSQAQSSGLIAFAPYSDIGEFGADAKALHGIGMVFSSSDPMRSAVEIKDILTGAGVTSGYTLFNVAEMLAQNRSLILIISIFIYGFIIMVSLIAIANVFNTISTGIRLRGREFAMLRSVGMGEGSFSKMMSFECVFYGLKALIYGLPVSVVVTFFIYKAVLNGVDVTFSMPWGSVAVSIFSVFFVVFVTMLYATRQIKKANVIDALRVEA